MSDEIRIVLPVPTRYDPEYNQRSWRMYAHAVEAAGGMPVKAELELSFAELSRLARECCGVVLPGSPADVDPGVYGQERLAACAEADDARNTVDRLLLEEAAKAGIPVLGICYGMQSLNVWRGGTLIQDLSPLPVNHAAGSSVAVAHAITVDADSRMGDLVDVEEGIVSGRQHRLLVNSSHHQAVDRVGTGLRVVAVSSQDGIVEAVEGVDGTDGPEFLLGVQWHPERSVDVSPTSRRIFAGLIAAAKKVRGRVSVHGR